LSQKRAAIIGVAASLCVTAALAIGILLFGTFGDTQVRILGTTALLGGYGLLALPAGSLLDQDRARALAILLTVVCAMGFLVSVAALWIPGPPDALGKSVGTLAMFAVATTQTAFLTARRTPHDPRIVGRLFIAATAIAFVVASMFSAAFWAGLEYEVYFRVAGALAVADALAVLLQPIVARLSPSKQREYRLKLYLDTGDELDFEIKATSLAKALAIAVAAAELRGRVARIERELAA
jgi:hypothetical protein